MTALKNKMRGNINEKIKAPVFRIRNASRNYHEEQKIREQKSINHHDFNNGY